MAGYIRLCKSLEIEVLSSEWEPCSECGEMIHESYDFHINRSDLRLYCGKCAFKNGLIESKRYLEMIGIGCDWFHATVDNGKIYVWTGKNSTPPHLRKPQQQRHLSIYVEWRNKVFKRDDYTCQKCGQRGGELNAHHIKSFKDYPKLRHMISNGITLCYMCHKEQHRKGGAKVGKTNKSSS